MRATLSVFLLGWLLLAQSIHASSPKSVLDDEEYAVYASLITDKFFGKNQRAVVIESRTTFNSIEDIIFFKTQPDLSQRVATVDERYEFLGQRLGGISPATLNAFREKDTQANEISPRLRLRVKYTLLSKEHVVRLFQQWQGSWKYPRTTGAISFSRVGFNAKRTEALVYVGFSCGERMLFILAVCLSDKDEAEVENKESLSNLDNVTHSGKGSNIGSTAAAFRSDVTPLENHAARSTEALDWSR